VVLSGCEVDAGARRRRARERDNAQRGMQAIGNVHRQRITDLKYG
jgi:hypothetical protein